MVFLLIMVKHWFTVTLLCMLPRFLRASSRKDKATGDIETQWMFYLCNGIVNEGCIPQNWKSSGKSRLRGCFLFVMCASTFTYLVAEPYFEILAQYPFLCYCVNQQYKTAFVLMQLYHFVF